jgi:hypothetical protein
LILQDIKYIKYENYKTKENKQGHEIEQKILFDANEKRQENVSFENQDEGRSMF